MFMAGIARSRRRRRPRRLRLRPGLLIAARALQGIGAADRHPLTLTCSPTRSAGQRGLAIGVWSGVKRDRRRAPARWWVGPSYS